MTQWHARVRAQLGAFNLDVNLRGDQQPVALIGPNGSGKTTLLHLIAGSIPPDSAEIVFNANTWHSSDKGIHVPIEARKVGLVPQGFGLFPHLSAIDNVAFGLKTRSNALPVSEQKNKARKLLERLDCSTLANRQVHQLSGGEKQRIALARALAIQPEVLLLDEPMASLDVSARRRIRSFLAQQLQAYGRPSILATHDVRDIELLEASVCVLAAGQIVQRGSLDELRSAPANEFVEEFLGLQPK